ncbi:MAG: ParB family transcriptional regulator, chromosome partitioning protein [Chloroflexota bacterium]|nr:ParB family transcriptional regulator, chromosome partitioning protein [Chloroflexota bacterium]
MGEESRSTERVEEVAVGAVHERRWRGSVDLADPGYVALRHSIAELGLIRPLLVRPRSEGGYELVRGARRLSAVRELGGATVAAVVRDLGDREALVGGAWPALMRSGCSEDEAAELREQLVAAGSSASEAAALTAVLGFEASSQERREVVLQGRPAWAWNPAGGA